MVRGKREERRERQRLRRSLQMQGLKNKVGVKEDRSESRDSQKQTQMKGKFNPFPGREALLRKLDSIEKLDALVDACRKLGVETSPRMVGGLGIIPLFSWYHESFDREKDINGIRIPSLEMACKDFHACKWPQGLSSKDVSLAQYFDALNEKNHDLIEDIRRHSSQIVTFSHFLPRPELCPEKRMLFYPNLPKIIGSDCLEGRLRSIHRKDGGSEACHVFGHTHFCWDAVLDGIRYVQAPLAYPRERKRRMNGGEDWLPFCIYYDGHLEERLSPCYWSDYYSYNKRQPENTKLAPWVARFYSR
eukprot:TRINITY_DN4116_c0_g2_i4.p1 TRINITY_DN4116_c0_g2~~TRINITY_DN4116_c0_g2_i4.p1  ORF type:complete len:319 (-),score=61.82 TRINITY_DN4116_c0_g2_i4:395-1303(-)